jgi:hypothetical protein
MSASTNRGFGFAGSSKRHLLFQNSRLVFSISCKYVTLTYNISFQCISLLELYTLQ